MSLSKQFYLIISVIFFMIFTGNFIISIKNTKEYLVSESTTKAQDTATALGLSLKNLIKDKNNPEIETIIKSIANSGFYKEIRLEDAFFSISDKELLNNIANLDNSNWKISNLQTNSKYGKIEKNTDDLEMSKELSSLENDSLEDDFDSVQQNSYTFTPTSDYKKGGDIPFSFTLTNEKNEKKDLNVNLNINKTLVQIIRDEKFDYVPTWFINLISIKLPEQSREISNGWQTTAKIFVSANAGEAYAKLYDQVKGSLIYAVIAFLISMGILFLFVQYLLKPLKKLEKLANNIAEGKFERIKKLPFTTEIKNVSIAFNDMSSKIESMIDKLNKNLNKITKKLSKDDLTMLPLKQSFETDMKDIFISKSDGYVFLVKIFDLGAFAKSHTNNEVNDFIKKFANILKETQLENKKTNAYRFFGSEFALLARNFSEEETKKFIEILQEKIAAFSYEYNKKDIMHIGASKINPFSTIPEMIQSSNEAYEKATLIGTNEAYITDSSKNSRNMEEWRDLIFDIINNSKFDVGYIQDCYSLKNSEHLLMQEAFTSIKDDDNNDIPIGTFVSIAEKYEKVVEFDKKVVTKVINHILINSVKHDISINLSLESLNNTGFIAWLEEIISKHKNISTQLVFSITAYAAAKDIDKFKFFVNEMHEHNARVIMKRFETKFIPLESLKELNLDFIRLARDYTTHITTDLSKQSFVESIQDLANLLNIKVYAENVESDEDFAQIQEYNLDGASR